MNTSDIANMNTAVKSVDDIRELRGDGADRYRVTLITGDTFYLNMKISYAEEEYEQF